MWAVLIALFVTAPLVGPFARYKYTSWRAGFDYVERNNIRGNETDFGVRMPDDGSIISVRPGMPRTIRQKLSFSINGPDASVPMNFSIIANNKTDLGIPLDNCELEPETDGLLLLSGEECGAVETYSHVYLAPTDAPFLALLYQSHGDEHDRIERLRVYHNGFQFSVSAPTLQRADWEMYLTNVRSTLDANFVILSD